MGNTGSPRQGMLPPGDAEWLEADGLGGFASGTVSGIRTRRYHALLLSAASPPTDRFALVNGLEVWLETPTGNYSLSSHRYEPDVIHPDGHSRIKSFTSEPWPTWTFEVEDGTRVVQELVAVHGQPRVCVRWSVSHADARSRLIVRPLLSCRDYHSLHHENSVFAFDAVMDRETVTWHPYDGPPTVSIRSNGRYDHDPVWYRNFYYKEEAERGLDATEDLASPGSFVFNGCDADAVMILEASLDRESLLDSSSAAKVRELFERERARRSAFATPLHRAGDSYIVQRGGGKTIIAGYPWFTDWGRDTFIALRGLCLATGRWDDAESILFDWSNTVSKGMLPNRFPDRGASPEFNSVDASLWYVVAVFEYLQSLKATGRKAASIVTTALCRTVEEIIDGFSKGTRFGISLAEDGLLRAGEAGVQLTWMDAKVGDWVVTPRIGKPVEVQALWLNALQIGQVLAGHRAREWEALIQRATSSFESRFWNDRVGYLNDVVDVGHIEGTVDSTLRPNQIFAVGGLPFAVLSGEKARRIVDMVESRLWTPLGLRTLSDDHPDYRATYGGGVRDRDGAYHQGTAWPWLMGAFVEAWLATREQSAETFEEARHRFVVPLKGHLSTSGLGHVSEIVEGQAPHEPRGCPFQAWSVGELLRLEEVVLRSIDIEHSSNRNACAASEQPLLQMQLDPKISDHVIHSVMRTVKETVGGRFRHPRVERKESELTLRVPVDSYHIGQMAIEAFRRLIPAGEIRGVKLWPARAT